MSGTINNGGPAFPTPVCEEPHCEVCESKSAGTGIFFGGTQGMTLRDYFAAKAMGSLLSYCGPYEDDETSPFAFRCGKETAPTVDDVANYAYSMADAMLRAREPK